MNRVIRLRSTQTEHLSATTEAMAPYVHTAAESVGEGLDVGDDPRVLLLLQFEGSTPCRKPRRWRPEDLLVATFSQPWVRVAGLAGVSISAFAAMAVFWTVPPVILSVAARPAGIAFISSRGILASATSPLLVGRVRDVTGSFIAAAALLQKVTAQAHPLIGDSY